MTHLQIQLKNALLQKESASKEASQLRERLAAREGRLAEVQENLGREKDEAAAEGEEAKARSDSLEQRVQFLQTRLHSLQTELTDKEALITRVRNECQTAERNHAIKTAMLATTEAAHKEAREQLKVQQEALVVTQERADRNASETKRLLLSLDEERAAAAAFKAEHEREQEHMFAEHERGLVAMADEHASMTAELSTEHSKQLSAVKSMLSQREASASELEEKVRSLQTEIASGAPNERRIFELAAVQAKREAGHGKHRDARELAFVQLQEALVRRDMEVAQLAQSKTALEDELLALRRHTKRDGVNMAYLKNVVLQFMVFPLTAPERLSLVPVISMLLQFAPDELRQATAAARNPNFSPRPVKEIVASMAERDRERNKTEKGTLTAPSTATTAGGDGSPAPERHFAVPITGLTSSGPLRESPKSQQRQQAKKSESRDKSDQNKEDFDKNNGTFVPPQVSNAKKTASIARSPVKI